MPEDRDVSRLARGVRLDLVIALCALLISTLATGASWWQARVMQAQTEVLAQQLGAQVWPYVDVSETLGGDTAKIIIENEGLGPAVLRSELVSVSGTPKSGFIDVMKTILKGQLRAPRGEKMHLELSENTPGSVLRPGDSTVAFALTSARFAKPFMREYQRIAIRICYCAIVSGKCWQSDSSSSRDPQPVAACPAVAHDLLRSSAATDLLNDKS